MAPGALLVVTPTSIDRSAGDEEITYRAAVEYDLTPESLLYASFETGFRAGGFNITFGQEEYDPEFIDAWTVGSKNRFFDNSLQVNLEGFYWKYKGQQLAAAGRRCSRQQRLLHTQCRASSIPGAEMDFQFLATDTTPFRGGVQYLDATYDSFEFNQVDTSDPTNPPNSLTPVTGCPYTQILTPRRSFDIDCSGKPALYAPKWTLNFGIEQTIFAGGVEFIAAVDARYRSDRVLGFNYLPTGNSGDDLTIDASVNMIPEDSGLTITLFMRNVTDEAVPSTYQLGAGNVATSAYEPPRTYGLRVGYEF